MLVQSALSNHVKLTSHVQRLRSTFVSEKVPSEFAKLTFTLKLNVNGNYVVIHKELLLFISENKRLYVEFM